MLVYLGIEVGKKLTPPNPLPFGKLRTCFGKEGKIIMLYIFLGPDDYTKKQHIKTLVKDLSADLIVYEKPETLPYFSELLETDLFNKPKVLVVEFFLPEVLEHLETLTKSANIIIFSLTALDKRKKDSKELLSQPLVTVKEFNLPHGLELNKWIISRVAELRGKIAKPAVEELAIRLGRDNFKETKFGGKVVEWVEAYNLWQVENEINKLLAFAHGREITEADVKLLVENNLEIDVFLITNAIGEGDKALAWQLMEKFIILENESEEKGGIIHLNALLSEQMRNLLVIQNSLEQKASDAEILSLTGWKPGRLFILKKLAQKIKSAKILEILPKLEALDEELKTSQTPPRVLWDLIMAQIF